jgi:uncharacterized protein YqgC (DUF456 family)
VADKTVYDPDMTTEQIVGLALALLLMGIGMAGSVLPGLPGTPLILVAAIGHRLYFGDKGAGPVVLTVLVLLTVLSLGLDYAASIFGAKKFGATKRGIIGAVVGCLVGLFFGLPGVLLGPFLGALLFELIGGREFNESARAGLGASLGLLAGAAGKLFFCLLMMALFTANVIHRSV